MSVYNPGLQPTNGHNQNLQPSHLGHTSVQVTAGRLLPLCLRPGAPGRPGLGGRPRPGRACHPPSLPGGGRCGGGDGGGVTRILAGAWGGFML